MTIFRTILKTCERSPHVILGVASIISTIIAGIAPSDPTVLLALGCYIFTVTSYALKLKYFPYDIEENTKYTEEEVQEIIALALQEQKEEMDTRTIQSLAEDQKKLNSPDEFIN